LGLSSARYEALAVKGGVELDGARLLRCLGGLSLNDWPVQTKNLNHRKGY